MTPWIERPTIEIDSDRPVAEALSVAPPEALAQARGLLAAIVREVPANARWLADAARVRTGGRFQPEAAAFAGAVGATWRDVMLANLSYDLALAALGCSTLALPTPSGPVLARNMDWWPEDVLAQASYLIEYRRGGKLSLANAGWPGAIGAVTGMSQRGFALALNAALSPEGSRRTGYPVLLFLRRVLDDAESFDAALAMLRDQTLATPALITVVGCENRQRVVIERTPTRHALRWGEPGKPLIATNDYRLLFAPVPSSTAEDTTASSVASREEAVQALYESTCSRYKALCQRLADHDAGREVDDMFLLYALTDPAVIQSITAQHVIIRPRPQTARLFVPRKFIEPEGAIRVK